jgi:hypothetical protein
VIEEVCVYVKSMRASELARERERREREKREREERERNERARGVFVV